MRYLFRAIQVITNLIIAVWIISSGTSTIHAAWALNTPESQTGALWAGKNLVWNDNRLGSSDIFIRHGDGVASPLLTGVGDQTVLAAYDQSLLISDTTSGSQNLYVYGLENHVLKPLGQYPSVTSSSIFADQAAWSDGALVWWWNEQKISSRPFLATQLLITADGLFVMEKDQITLWSGGEDQLISCLACVKMVPYLDQIALLDGLGTLKLRKSNENIDVGVSALLSNQSSLVYQIAETTFVYRNQQKIQYNQVIKSNTQLGQTAIANVEKLDIVLDPILPPSVQILSCNLGSKPLECSGTGFGYRIVARAVDQKGVESVQYLNILNDVWSGQILSDTVADGVYDISMRAESVFGQLSEWTLVGKALIDSTPPKIVENELKIGNDSARIHLQTDEKTSAIINLTSADQSIVRTQNRLTFSHTTTFNDLDADVQFDVNATLTDAAANSVQSHTAFATPPLTSPSYQIRSTFDKSQAGVWEGELYLPPGVIDDKVAVLRVSKSHFVKSIRLQWTIGLPPFLNRHRLVRVKGRINSAGTAILLHRAKAIAIIDATSDPPIFTQINANAVIKPDQFVEISGELTRVAKTGWRIKNGETLWRVHWEGPSPDGMSKGDIIQLKGYTYSSGEELQIAGIEAVLIEKAPPKTVKTVAINKIIIDDAPAPPQIQTLTVDKPSATFATVKLTKTETTAQNNVTEVTITMQTANVYDKNENLWYNLVLYGTGVIINFTYFFRRRKQPRRAS